MAATREEEFTKEDTNNEGNLNEEFTEISEGKAKILFPKANTVFYNNVQVFNRDLSVAVIKRFLKEFDSERKTTKKNTSDFDTVTEELQEDKKESQKRQSELELDQKIDAKNAKTKISVLEALSATGLRAVRYALEIDGIDRFIANDLSKEAVKSIERNIKHNKVEKLVKSSLADASLLMYQHRFPLWKRFQVIDLDPYGSPCQFLDGAVQAIDDGGLLCITCTDMGGLCGNHGEAAFAKYGGMPLKAKYCHEMALRIVLACIDSHAGRYKRYIEPLIALSADFYIRVFVRVYTSAAEVKRSASKKSYVFHCNGCETFHFQPVGKSLEVGNSKKYNPASGPVVNKTCEQCNHTFKIGGPIWSEPIHNTAFLTDLLKDVNDEKDNYETFDRINGVLTLMLEELEDQPLYHVLDHLCNIIHSTTPSHAQFRSAILHAGYKVSSTHANEIGIKTDAPVSVIWDILRCWVKKHPVNPKKIKDRSPAKTLLSRQPELGASFEVIPEAVPKSKLLKLTRYPINPEADWGPKARAKQNNQYESLAEKRQLLQGKRKRGQDNKSEGYHKQFPCKRFKRGECDLGDSCKYNHSTEEKEKMTTESSEAIES